MLWDAFSEIRHRDNGLQLTGQTRKEGSYMKREYRTPDKVRTKYLSLLVEYRAKVAVRGGVRISHESSGGGGGGVFIHAASVGVAWRQDGSQEHRSVRVVYTTTAR